MKNSNDTIGNRTRDLPTCSAVPQPTAPPRAPYMYVVRMYYACMYVCICYVHKSIQPIVGRGEFNLAFLIHDN